MTGSHTIGRKKRNLTLAVLCTGIFLAALDQTVVVTVLPRMIEDLEGGFSSGAVERAGWIVTSYLFGYTVVLPLLGRISDRFGHRRIYILSISIFALGSILCALSWSLYAMVGFRAIQAIGGGAVIPVTIAVAIHDFPVKKRALALGIIGAAAEAGSVLGPLYGSLLGQFAGWRAIFYLNLPLTLVIIWLVMRIVRRDSPAEGEATIDYRSGILLTLALGLAVVGISGASEAGWIDFGLPLLMGSVVVLAVFFISDFKSKSPLIDPSLYASLPFTSANAAHLLLGAALITALVQVPTFAYAAGWPETAPSAPLTGGLLLIRLTLMIPVGAIVGGILSSRLSGRFPAVGGFLLSALGLWQMSRWPADVGSLRQTADLILTGAGFGMVIAPISFAAVNELRKSRMASGAAVLTASRTIGMTIGLAAINSWGINEFQTAQLDFPAPLPRLGLGFSEYLDQLREWEHQNVALIMGVLSDFFLIAAILCLLAVIPALLMGRSRGNGSSQV